MAKNTYVYILEKNNTIEVFNNNYDLLSAQGVNLIPEHSERNAYVALGKIQFQAGEWTKENPGEVNGYSVYRINKNSILELADEN